MMSAVAINLASNLTTWPKRAVNVYVRGSGAHGSDKFIDFAGVDSLSSRRCGSRDVGTYVGGHDCARNRRGWRRARLSSRGTVAEITAEKHADAAIHTLLSKVDVSLLDSAFQVGISKLPFNPRFIVADSSIERSITGCRNRRNLLISGQELADLFKTLGEGNRRGRHQGNHCNRHS